ncbi:MAG: DUF692 family protein [Woeseiaceae bacterium]|nr:DUF692 family protein [Woeseiaceae bacterium]
MTDATRQYAVSGAGLGLRRGLMDPLMADPPAAIDFMEVAPENWINVGGKLGKKLALFYRALPVPDSWAVAQHRFTRAA